MQKDKSYWATVYDIKTWISVHTNHLNYTRNLILTIAIASLGFTISQYQKLSYNLYTKWLLINAIIVFGISILLGLVIAIVQSKIYRLYRTISREIAKQTGEEFDESIFKKSETKCTDLEKCSAIMFWWQLVTYFLGIALLIGSVFIKV